MEGHLIFADGEVFSGRWQGARVPRAGEVVFNTGMTGYQEILTDPSYAGQIVVLTYPQIGNYGLGEFNQSDGPQVEGFIIEELWGASGLAQVLAAAGVPLLSGPDTRALVRRLRETGDQMALLWPGPLPDPLPLPPERPTDLVQRVSSKTSYVYHQGAGPHVVVVDLGSKKGILEELRERDCRITVVPATASAAEIEALHPDGVVFSNGPGDPLDCRPLLPAVRQVAEQVPALGICLGHQLLALAFGARTSKLLYGHRGVNHPVRDLTTGRVWITSQNHGYTVEPQGLPKELVVTHEHVNDGSIEGLRHRHLPWMSVQYHPEANPGPKESTAIFDEFLMRIYEGGVRVAQA